MNKLFGIAVVCFLFLIQSASSANPENTSQIIFKEDFSNLHPGMFSGGVVGARAEYHFIDAVKPRGNWVVSSFRSDESQRAWRVLLENGRHILQQSITNTPRLRIYTHPMVIAGDDLWKNYTVSIRFAPDSKDGRSGILFRYHNDRCYYFFGVDAGKAILKMVKHADSYRTANETVLAEKETSYTPGEYLTATVTVKGPHITAALDNGTVLRAEDNTYPHGKIGLMADDPARYSEVKVSMTPQDRKAYEAERAKKDAEEASLQAANPKMKLWKKIYTDGFGVGRSLRFGDLNGDGQTDVLIGQVIHHGPKDRNSELSCLTAVTFDGKKLWQVGEPDLWRDYLTNDVAFQIHDVDNDGRNEVVYAMNTELVVADGATGETKYKIPTPINRSGPPHDKFPRILGDCLYFLDVEGRGYPYDILIKDRYKNFYVFNEKLEMLWDASCNTGHYPYARDIDNDGKDEIAIGYSLYDDDGRQIFSLDKKLKDHADGVAIVDFDQKGENNFRILNSASDEGMVFYDLKGNIIKQHYLGHVQNPAVANFRSDLPGLEAISINFWGNQGIIHFYNSQGDVYYDFEPVQHGSMMLPINWTGKDEEFFVLSANVEEGGLFDGWGRRVVKFPGDGHPDMCFAVLDITGDCRDEIVVWDPGEIWVYTQDDNPRKGKLYKPVRNPLYNYSNYQATVSLPGWSQ